MLSSRMVNDSRLPYCVGTNNGTGYSGAGTSKVSYSDTVPADADCTVVWVLYSYDTAPTVTVKVGNSSATSRGAIIYNPISFTRLACYGLFSPPTGSQTIEIAFATHTARTCAIASAHYVNASSFGTATNVSAQSGSPMTMTVASTSTAQLYLNQLGYSSGVSGTISAYNKNQQVLCGAGNGTAGYPFVAGDAPGNGGTVTFSADRSDTARTYAGLIVPLAV